ncbi:hypothetical protein G6F68_018552 [Rhizopus microsporus]|nr:hypothetical protein G6F68_018552 [Rhizopus microsporus]
MLYISEFYNKIYTEEEESEDEFFDAPSEFTNITIEPVETKKEEKPIGPIDLKYKKRQNISCASYDRR